ncbi:MAG TPA: DUF4390 domain-containing protein [Longimicrobiales bacterium]|nr:DUF4390 domain-containing protein [Longimicrobiales bacterium]
MIRAGALLGSAALVLAGVRPLHAQATPLRVVVDAASGSPHIAVGPVLADPALHEAVRSGLPLRLRFTVELWKDEWFDDLAGQQDWSAVLAYEPLERLYLAGDENADALGRFSAYDDARAVIERVWSPPLRPSRRGRYYYLVTLEVETLSLSDLDELERWLGGELEPAVRGGGSVTGAVGQGVKRLLIRILDLPARRYIARSERFDLR